MSAVQGFEFGGDSEAIKNRFSTTSTKLSGFTNFVTFTSYCDQQSMSSKKQEGEVAVMKKWIMTLLLRDMRK